MKEKINPISDFDKLQKSELPESEKKHSETDIAKFYFIEIENLLLTQSVIVDLQNKVAQTKPDTAHFLGETDIVPFDIELSDEDIEKIIEILEKGHIEEWKETYRFGDKELLDQMGGEGYNWTLFIQYKDGSMQFRSGKGIEKEKIQPEGYETFVKEITEFINDKNEK